jgi:cellulose biosynthesis protein BcsS
MAHRRAGRESGAAVRERVGWLACLAVLLVAVPAEAARYEGIAGWEGDAFGQGYGFLTGGVIVRDKAPLAIPFRVSASYLYYEFDDDAGHVTVQAPGASALLGIRRSGRAGSFSLMAGGEGRRERRERNADGAGVVWRGGFVGQAECGLSAGRFQPLGLVVYSGASKYVYGRALLRWQLTNRGWSGPTTWYAGVEGVGQGNADVTAAQGGLALDCTLVRARTTLSVRGGVKRSDSGNGNVDGGYVGVGLYRAF